jgi:hypothetical protein
MDMADDKDAPLSETEIKCRFEAALHGSRMAEPHPMKEYVGKGKKSATKGRLRKPPRSEPQSP